MHVHRAAVTPAFFTATRFRECAGCHQTHAQNQGQGDADRFRYEQSNSENILIHSDLVYIMSIYCVNKNIKELNKKPEFDFSDLDIIWNLRIGVWDFNTVSGNENRFFLNQLEPTLTLP